MIQGTPKFNGLVIANFEAVTFGPEKGKLKAKAAFINSETGHTHGWTTRDKWSPAVLQKMQELAEAMEAELASVHFDGVSSASPGKGVSFDEESGLGNHIGTEAPPA